MIDMEIAVEPELYSTIVLVSLLIDSDCNMFKATSVLKIIRPQSSKPMFSKLRFTWESFDIICWQHIHHLGIDMNPVIHKWIELSRNLDQG